MQSGGAAPTGCYKCGRPGHWSRDCLSTPSNSSSSQTPPVNLNLNSKPNSTNQFLRAPQNLDAPKSSQRNSDKLIKPPRTRPKLTPELLLSNDGIGYILRHFPRAFKYRGRGYEVSDLRHLIGLYSQWHSHLLPYYSFNQFIEKVERVGATKRVKMCMTELREKVASEGDPAKLHEPTVEDIPKNDKIEKASDLENSAPNAGDMPLEDSEPDRISEDILNEAYKNASEDASVPPPAELDSQQTTASEKLVQAAERESNSSEISISQAQRDRMESNRQKALEKMAARLHSVSPS